ncbi:hypothetical protein J31TS6_07910 [Brevibacillus reuszeri]|nr:hypothetical protein J31TS6_07910 [Brevibacillus reuszeri]
MKEPGHPATVIIEALICALMGGEIMKKKLVRFLRRYPWIVGLIANPVISFIRDQLLG